MPMSFADSADGVVLAADGIDPMLRWDGYDSQFDEAGVEAPTDTPAAAGSGSGTLTGTYVCFMRYVDSHGNYSNPTPFSAQFVLASNLQVDYTNLQSPSDPSVVRRQILRNSNGQSATFYVDIDTTDVGSSALSSTRTDDDLVVQEAQPLFADDGTPLYDRFNPPPDTVAVVAPHLGRVWGAGIADYSEGSVSVTNGSPNVTGTMADWRVGFAGRFLHVGGADKPYEILSVNRTAGTLVLVDPYDGPTNPFAGYTIRPDPTLTQQVSFSEAGKPEAWPPDNALTLREDGDRPTSIILSGSFLYIGKRRSLTKITAQGEPKSDAYLYDSAKRGCVSHRAWTRVEEDAYVLDEQGVYRFDGRSAEPISTRIQDFFRGNNRFGFRINWRCARFFHALHCPLEETVRFFVTINGSYLPRFALAYGTKSDKWWLEEYPYPIGASILGRIGRTSGGWGGTKDQPFLAGLASRVWAIEGNLDGVPAWQPDYLGECVAAGPVTVTPPAPLGDEVVGAPITIVKGRGRDQTRLIVAVRNDGTIVVDRPWTVRPAAGDRFGIGTIPYVMRTHRLSYEQSETDAEFTIEVGYDYKPDGEFQVRVFSDWEKEPDKLIKDHGPAQDDGISGAAGDLGLTAAMTHKNGVATVRGNRHLDKFVEGVTMVAIELAGHSGPSQHTFNKLVVSGVDGS